MLEDVAFGPLNQGKTTAEAVALARETMAKLGLEGFEERITYKLSGGEKKLVALATVLAMQPEVLLLDEPTAGLDERSAAGWRKSSWDCRRPWCWCRTTASSCNGWPPIGSAWNKAASTPYEPAAALAPAEPGQCDLAKP